MSDINLKLHSMNIEHSMGLILRFQNLLHVSLREKTHEMFRARKWWSYFVGHHCEMMTSGERVLIWETMGHECKRDVFMDSSSTFGSHLQTPAFICYTKKLFHILSHQIIYHTGGRLWLVGFCDLVSHPQSVEN